MTRHAVDIELIRVAFEREASAALERKWHYLRQSYRRPDARGRRRELLGSCLRLTETMAPEAYSAAHEAMAALGAEDSVELYQSSGRGVDTARPVLAENPIGIEFIGGYLTSLDRGALLAVLGHEIGHCLSHLQVESFGWALSIAQSGPAAKDARAYAMAAELTADRFGLLACQDLQAA